MLSRRALNRSALAAGFLSLAALAFLVALRHDRRETGRSGAAGQPRRADAVDAEIVHLPLPPAFPDPGKPGFRAEAEKQARIAEKELALIKDVLGRTERDLVNSLTAIELCGVVKFGREKELTGLVSLRRHLEELDDRDWGSNTNELRRRARESRGFLDEYEACRRLMGRWKSQLARLEEVLGEREGGGGRIQGRS